MADQPNNPPKQPPQSDQEVKAFIAQGGRPGAEKDFEAIIKRAAEQPKK